MSDSSEEDKHHRINLKFVIDAHGINPDCRAILLHSRTFDQVFWKEELGQEYLCQKVYAYCDDARMINLTFLMKSGDCIKVDLDDYRKRPFHRSVSENSADSEESNGSSDKEYEIPESLQDICPNFWQLCDVEPVNIAPSIPEPSTIVNIIFEIAQDEPDHGEYDRLFNFQPCHLPEIDGENGRPILLTMEDFKPHKLIISRTHSVARLLILVQKATEWRRVELYYNGVRLDQNQLLSFYLDDAWDDWEHLHTDIPKIVVIPVYEDSSETPSATSSDTPPPESVNQPKFYDRREPLKQIIVKGLDGRSITLDVEASDTIADIKTKINEKKRIPVDAQRLVYAGKQLENEKTLESYHTINLATFHLSLPLGGGMGKRARVGEDDEFSSKGNIPPRFGKIDILTTDIEAVKNALSLNDVKVEAWVESLSKEDLLALEETVDKYALKGGCDTAIRSYAEFIAEMKALKDMVINFIFVLFHNPLVKQNAFQKISIFM
jgi:hypothetical protein